MLVVDASSVVDLLLAKPHGEEVDRHIAEHHDELHTPQLFDLEVLNALRRALIRREIPEWRGHDAVADLLDLRINRYPHQGFLERIWTLRNDFTAYDASYLALTETLSEDGAALLTTDASFARALREHSDVEVLLAA
jgi:predicted nucleic acid-binding protein